MWLDAIKFIKSTGEIVVIQMAFLYPKMIAIDMQRSLPFFLNLRCLITFNDSTVHFITYFHTLFLALWALIGEFFPSFS